MYVNQPTSATSHPNLLILSNNEFRQSHISSTIADTLKNSEKVLIIASGTNLNIAMHTYELVVPQDRTRTMTDLAIQIMPENKPFLAFGEWDVIITTPDYLRVPLTSHP